MSNHPVQQRIAQAVIRLVHNVDSPAGLRLEVPFPLTRQDLADMTGTTLHTVNRTLAAWEQQGLVERGRQRIVVTDGAAIAALAQVRQRDGGSPRRMHRRNRSGKGPL